MRSARTILKILGWVWLTLVLPFAWISIQVIEQLPRNGFPQNLYDTTLGFLFLPGWPIILTCSVLGLLLLVTIITGIFVLFGKRDETPTPTIVNKYFISGSVQIISSDKINYNVTRNINYLVTSGTLEKSNEVSIQGGGPPTEKYGIVPREAPLVSRQFTGRTSELAALKNMLFQQTRTLGIVGVKGVGGIGKTKLAAELANDPDVVKAFSHGTLWTTVQGSRDYREILVHWIQVIYPSIGKNLSELDEWSLLTIFFQMIQDRHILIILDDVNTDSIWFFETLSRGMGKYSKILITSRLVNLPGVENLVTLDVLPEQAALTLIETGLGRRLSKEEQIIAREIAFMSGYLPLALNLVIGQIKASGISIGELRDRLRDQIGYRGTVGLDEVRESVIGRVFDKIYGNLPVIDQRRFRALAVFQAPFNVEAAAAVWRVIPLKLNIHLLNSFKPRY